MLSPVGIDSGSPLMMKFNIQSIKFSYLDKNDQQNRYGFNKVYVLTLIPTFNNNLYKCKRLSTYRWLKFKFLRNTSKSRKFKSNFILNEVMNSRLTYQVEIMTILDIQTKNNYLTTTNDLGNDTFLMLYALNKWQIGNSAVNNNKYLRDKYCVDIAAFYNVIDKISFLFLENINVFTSSTTDFHKVKKGIMMK
ncbi:hypothetical protein AGLY_015321 [Aphis glycines]|uniref:Uncharacterized protein n=1 Tax=Aphis glycines TaxID=307491 RepID=A0A6G0T199_APHGL|nr:hypothetical protein AGLY_015321 [Aphis glycines]